MTDSTQKLGAVASHANGNGNGRWLGASKVAWALLGVLGSIALYLGIVALTASADNCAQEAKIVAHHDRITAIESAVSKHCDEQRQDMKDISKQIAELKEIVLRLQPR